MLVAFHELLTNETIDASRVLAHTQWAIVSDHQQLSLFILARDPTKFTENYENDVLNLVRCSRTPRWWTSRG